jgi:hypothetical protein
MSRPTISQPRHSPYPGRLLDCQGHRPGQKHPPAPPPPLAPPTPPLPPLHPWYPPRRLHFLPPQLPPQIPSCPSGLPNDSQRRKCPRRTDPVAEAPVPSCERNPSLISCKRRNSSGVPLSASRPNRLGLNFLGGNAPPLAGIRIATGLCDAAMHSLGMHGFRRNSSLEHAATTHATAAWSHCCHRG